MVDEIKEAMAEGRELTDKIQKEYLKTCFIGDTLHLSLALTAGACYSFSTYNDNTAYMDFHCLTETDLVYLAKLINTRLNELRQDTFGLVPGGGISYEKTEGIE